VISIKLSGLYCDYQCLNNKNNKYIRRFRSNSGYIKLIIIVSDSFILQSEVIEYLENYDKI